MSNTLLLQDIESKIKKIKSRNLRLEKENEELRKSVFDYLQKLETQKNEVQVSQSALNAAYLGKNTKMDTKKLKKDLDRYIQMIDKCIAAVKVSL